MLRSFTRLRGILLALGLGAAQACSQRPADQPAPAGSPAGAALSVAEARAWYQATYAGSTAAATPGPQLPATASAAGAAPGGAAPGGAPAALVWERALTVGAGSQQLVLVPLTGDAALFARRPYAGTRYLVVARTSPNALDGSLVEVLLRHTPAPLDTLALFVDLYRSYRSGQFAAPGAGEGYVFLYSADYRYQAGRPFRHGQFVRSSARLGFQPVPGTSPAPATGKENGGVAKTNNVPPIGSCIDWYDASTGDFIVRTGNCDDGGGVPYIYTPGSSSPGPSGYGGHGTTGGGAVATLNSQLAVNSLALLNPCPGLTNAWRPLLNFKPSSSVTDRLNNLTAQEKGEVLLAAPNEPVNIAGDTWQIQAIQNAGGVAINLDYFSVDVTQLPSQFSTPEQLLNSMRLNFNSYINTFYSSFSPNPLLPGEGNRWSSQNPLGTIISISIPGNSGSVITSDYDTRHWIFSTIHDPLNGNHPVSGNREFGFVPISSGGYTFYVRGVDRIDSRFAEFLGSVTNPPVPFLAADNLWQSWQNGLATSVNNNGGHASINQPITNRPNWTSVLAALQNNAPLATVPCK